jgi:hypothetical protein
MSDIVFYSDHLLASAVPPTKTDWGFDHLRPLHKAICADIVKNPDSNGDEEYGLVFKCRDGKIRTAWIMCDPEGNGAGHLDIVGGDK